MQLTPHQPLAGNDRSMLIPNVLFRANGSAVLLSNKRRDMRRSKYFIRNIVRTHLASDDVAYNCVIQMEDAERNVSVCCSKDTLSQHRQHPAGFGQQAVAP